MRDIQNVVTHGLIRDDPSAGITEIARPKGVIGAVVPSTHPSATPANNIINALKCGNAIVVAPSPKGVACCEMLLHVIHAELAKIGEDADLVQKVPAPGSKEKTQRLTETCDMIANRAIGQDPAPEARGVDQGLAAHRCGFTLAAASGAVFRRGTSSGKQRPDRWATPPTSPHTRSGSSCRSQGPSLSRLPPGAS